MDSDFRPRPRPLRQPLQRQHSHQAHGRPQTTTPSSAARSKSTRLEANAMSGSLAPKVPTPKRRTHSHVSRRTFYVVSSVVLITAVGLVVRMAFIQEKTPKPTATAFVQDLERGDTVAALKLSIDQYQLPQTAAAIKDGSITFSQQNSRVQQASSHQGIVAFTITTKNGTKYVRVELMKQTNQTWRVSNVVVSDQPQNTIEVT